MQRQVSKNMQVGLNGNIRIDYDESEARNIMTGKIQESQIKEVLKKIIDGNMNIPEKAKWDLKMIIEAEHDPEKLLQECLLYMMSYSQ